MPSTDLNIQKLLKLLQKKGVALDYDIVYKTWFDDLIIYGQAENSN